MPLKFSKRTIIYAIDIKGEIYTLNFSKVQYLLNCMSRDTPVTPYARPPVSTDSATRDRLRDCRNLRQSTAIYHILPCPAEFC